MKDPDATPQMENETLNIDDTQKGTRGGPPGWLAFAIVGIFFVVTALVVGLVMLAMG
jgi:hypothetical protein